MLIEAMRKQGETWWFRAFLFLLACLFIYQWGFHGMITGSTSSARNLVSVGGSKINVNQFARELSRELGRIKINLKADLSEQQQKQLYPYVLETMVNNLLLEREADRLGLRVTDDQIKYVISEDANFKSSEGTFNHSQFNNFLNNIQMSEKDFIDTLRKELRRKMLMKTLGQGITAPQMLTTRLYSYEHQRRVLQVTAIESDQLKLAKEPTESEIQAYFNQNPAKFTAPEYRDITALIITRSLTLKDVKINENQVKDYFDHHEDEFKDRKFDQVKEEIRKELEKKEANEKLFTLANKIDDALAGGASLEEIAKTYDIELKFFPSISIEGIYDPQYKTDNLKEVAVNDPLQLRLINEAFNEKENESSKVIEDSEGKFFVSHINKIYSAHPLTYEESKYNARELLIQDLKSAQAKTLALELESAVNQNGLLSRAAQERGLKTTQIRVTRKGPLGPSAVYLPDNFIETLYHIKVGGAKATSYINDNNQQDYIVGFVEKVEPLETPIAEDQLKEFKDQLQGELFNDLFVQYVTSLRKVFPVEYNNKALESLTK